MPISSRARWKTICADGIDQKDTSYYEEHREELLKKYSDKWVAIYEEHVVGTAKDLSQLITRLQKEEIPKGRAFVEYLTEKEDLLIL